MMISKVFVRVHAINDDAVNWAIAIHIRTPSLSV
jgi:hypothetical protein